MFRSIFKGSFLAASFCVIALSSNAEAKSSSSLARSGDMNLIETQAGMAYAAEKSDGATCIHAVKTDRDAKTEVAKASGTAPARGFSNGTTTVN